MLDSDEETTDAEYIVKRLKKFGQDKKIVTKREIYAKCRCQKFKSVFDIDEPLEILKEMRYIREIEVEPTGKRGRPTEKYKINPLIYSQK